MGDLSIQHATIHAKRMTSRLPSGSTFGWSLVFANHPNSEFHPSEPGWMNDSRFNGTAGSQ